jgi:LysM repeat protein
MMKFKFLLITLLLSSLSASLFANRLLDSIGVENQNGKKVILHKVEPHESFYSIARRYNVSPKALIAFNNNNTTLSIGQTIKVPTEMPFTEQSKPAQKPVGSNNNFHIRSSPAMENPPPAASTTQYKVSAGETLYAISKRFNTTVADITSLNNLKSTNLTPGQILLVRSAPEATAPAQVQQPVAQQQQVQQQEQPPTPVAKRDTTLVATQDSMNMANHNNMTPSRYGLNEKDEKGVAVWMDTPGDLDPNKKLILHRTAPIGTVIKITNPMTSRTTFAKVVGRINENENTKDAIIVMTKSVAESLGALDKRIHVDLSYGTPNE